MSRTVVIVIEGVLQSYTDQAPIPTGILLYHGLKTTFRVALVSDSMHEDKIKYWLDLHGFKEHPYLFPTLPTDLSDPGDRRMTQIGRLRQAGCAIDLLIEPNPQVAAKVMQAGITTLNYLHPFYAKPEFRPDHVGLKPRAWDELITETNRQDDLRVADIRLKEVQSND